MRTMIAAAFRLLALLALVLMPLGMGAGPVRAEASSGHSMAMPVKDHCGGEDSDKGGKVAGMHCSGSCSALPDSNLNQAAVAFLAPPPAQSGPESALIGLALLPSIPPPRSA